MWLICTCIGCKDICINPTVHESYSICYCGYGQIKINNISGTAPVNISIQDGNYRTGYYDDYPQWSPDGRYIVFQRLRPDTIYNPFICIYDTKNKTYTNLTSDGGIASSNPQWTPNGKVYFSYERPILSTTATYMMNPDGSDKRKILNDSAASIYFYQDSYTFLYSTGDGNQLYKTNIDGTSKGFVCDLHQTLNQYIAIQGFNPTTQELLFAYILPKDSSSRIAIYNIETKAVSDLLIADHGYTFFQISYSHDCSRIALIENSRQDEYLSIYQNGIKQRLVKILYDTTQGYQTFSWYSPEFSSDGKYIAFDKQVFGSGPWVNFLQYLSVVDVNTGDVQFVDKGFGVSWDPQP